MLSAESSNKIHELNNLIKFFNRKRISAPKGFWETRATVQQNLTGETPSIFSKIFKPLESLELLELPVGKPYSSINNAAIEKLENILYIELIKLKQKELTAQLEKYIRKNRVRVQLKMPTEIAMVVELFVATLKGKINTPCAEKDKKAKFLQLTELEKNLPQMLKKIPEFVKASDSMWLNCKETTSENNFDSINQILELPANFSVSESVKPSMAILRAVQAKKGVFENMVEKPLKLVKYLDEKIKETAPNKATASITHDGEEDKTSKQLKSRNNNKDVINALLELNTLIRCYNQHAISEPEGIRQRLGKVQDKINGTSASIFDKFYRQVGKIEFITWSPDYLIKGESNTEFLVDLVSIKTKLTGQLEQELKTKEFKFGNLLNALEEYFKKSRASSRAERQVAISLHVLFEEKYNNIEAQTDLVSKFKAITFLLKDLEAYYNGLVVLCRQNNFSPNPEAKLFTEFQEKLDTELSHAQREEVGQRLETMMQQRSQASSKPKTNNTVNSKEGDNSTEELSNSAENLETFSSSSSNGVEKKTKNNISRCKTSFFNADSLETLLTPLHKKALALNESPEKKIYFK